MSSNWNYSRPLRVAVKVSSVPFTYPCVFQHGLDEKRCFKPGVYVDIFRTILDVMNISVHKVQIVKVNTTKEVYELLNQSLVDVSAYIREPDPKTFNYLSFSKPIFFKERAYLMHSLTSKNTFHESVKMLQPFSVQVWGVIFALIMFSILLVYLLNVFSICRKTVFL